MISAVGEVDIATNGQLLEALDAALRTGAKRLVCDLSGWASWTHRA